MQKQALVKPWLLGASLSLPFAIGAAEAGDLVFDITYVDVTRQTSPTVANYSVNQHVIVTLHDGNRVTERRAWQTPKEGSSISVEGALGANVSGGRFSVKWHVENPHSLIRYREFPQHIEVLHIAVSGRTCQATIDHKLKPGFSTYERFGAKWEPYYYTSLQSTGIACRVTEQ